MPAGYVCWLHEKGALDKPDNAELKETFEALGILPNNLMGL